MGQTQVSGLTLAAELKTLAASANSPTSKREHSGIRAWRGTVE